MALRLGIQTGALPSGLLLADQDVFVGAIAASITGSVTHTHAVSATLGFGNFVNGSVTHGHAVAATELLKRANYSITMDITLTMTPAAVMGFNITASAITGSITHGHTVGAGLLFGATIAGDVTHGHTVSASLLDYTANNALAGSVTHGHVISAGMSYQVASTGNSIAGSVSHAQSINASTIFGAVHLGSVGHAHAVAAAMDFVANHAIVGSVLHARLVVGTLRYTVDGQYEIVGSVAHTHGISASMTYIDQAGPSARSVVLNVPPGRTTIVLNVDSTATSITLN